MPSEIRQIVMLVQQLFLGRLPFTSISKPRRGRYTERTASAVREETALGSVAVPENSSAIRACLFPGNDGRPHYRAQ